MGRREDGVCVGWGTDSGGAATGGGGAFLPDNKSMTSFISCSLTRWSFSKNTGSVLIILTQHACDRDSHWSSGKNGHTINLCKCPPNNVVL